MANTPVTSIRLPEDLREWAQKRAAEENRSMANFLITELYKAKAAEKKGRK